MIKFFLITLTIVLSQSVFSYVEALSLIHKESYQKGYALLEKNYLESKDIIKKRLMANVLAFAPKKYISGNPLGYALLALEDKKLGNAEREKLFVRAGDLAFEQNKLGLAKLNYLSAIGKEIDKEDLYVIYQLSWVLVNLGDYKESLRFIVKGLHFGESDYLSSLSENYGQFSLEAILHLKRVNVRPIDLDEEAFIRGAKKSFKLIKTSRHFYRFERALPKSKLKLLQKAILSNKSYKNLQEMYCKSPRKIKISLSEEEIDFVKGCKNLRLIGKLKGKSLLKTAFYHEKDKGRFCHWGMKAISWKSSSPIKDKFNVNVAKNCAKHFSSKHLKELVDEVNSREVAREALKIVLTHHSAQKSIVGLDQDTLINLPKGLLIPLLGSKALTIEEKLTIIAKGSLYLDKEVLKSFSFYLGKVKKQTALEIIQDDFFPFVTGLGFSNNESYLYIEATKIAFRFNSHINEILSLSSKLPEDIRASDLEYSLLSHLHKKDYGVVISNYNRFEKLLSKKPILVRELVLSEDWNRISDVNENNKLVMIRKGLESGRRISGKYRRKLDDLKLQSLAYPIYYLTKDIKRLSKKERPSMAYKVSLLKKIKRHQRRVRKVAKEKNWLVLSMINKYNDYINMTQKLFKSDANEQVRLLANEIEQWKLEIN